MVDGGDELLAIARNLIRTFREHGGTVGYVRVAFADGDWDGVPATSYMAQRVSGYGDAMHIDNPGTQIPEEIAPQDGDIVVIKKRVGPFGTTDLHEQLQHGESTRWSSPVSAPAGSCSPPSATPTTGTTGCWSLRTPAPTATRRYTAS